MPGTLDSRSEQTLVLGTGTSHAAGQNLCALRNVFIQAHSILVVNVFHVVHTKRTDLAAAAALRWPVAVKITVGRIIARRAGFICHEKNSS
jgi:hypothetical protein